MEVWDRFPCKLPREGWLLFDCRGGDRGEFDGGSSFVIYGCVEVDLREEHFFLRAGKKQSVQSRYTKQLITSI